MSLGPINPACLSGSTDGSSSGFLVSRSPTPTTGLERGKVAHAGAAKRGVNGSHAGAGSSSVVKLDPVTPSLSKKPIKEGVRFHPTEWVLKSHGAEKGNTTNKEEKIHEIEAFMSVNCAQHVEEPLRGTNVRKALDNLNRLYPSLSGVFLLIRRYVKELSVSTEALQKSHRLEIANIEQSVYKKTESFFEEKTLQLIRDKRRAEATARQLREEVLLLRKERDDELMRAKETVMVRLNDCERKETEFASFRKLIASVFKTNERLVNRIGDLEALLRKHRIGIPQIQDELYVYNKPKNNTTTNVGDGEGVKRIQDQVSPEFMEASRKEMNLARLSQQRELLNSAFDERTTYRLQVNGLRNENSALQTQIEVLQGQVLSLQQYIHEKRYLSSMECDDDGPLTPRPRDVPFSVQTDLGIDLKNSTSRVVAELAVVGTNLKHQLSSAVLALRQLASAVEWMEEETILKVAEQAAVPGAIPTFPTAEWPNIPHFLRTHIGPDVPNISWTETEVAALLMSFFTKYSSLRKACRFIRDSKMVTPRTYQLFERCRRLLVRLDATQTEVQQSEDNVPFGYVVSYFISKMLKTITPDSFQFRMLQPGTLNPLFLHRGERDPVEMEFGKCSYNLWYSALRYKEQQPLCRLFVDVVDGRLPVELFDFMQRVLRNVDVRIHKFDLDGSNSFTYNKLIGSVLKLVADMDTQVGISAILSVMETFKMNQVQLMGGRIFTSAILADESCVESGSPPRNYRHQTLVGMRMPKKDNAMHGTQGASVLTRFWRKLIIERHERAYCLVERILGPLVIESHLVIGLFLLPIPLALDAAKQFDENQLCPTESYMALAFPFLLGVETPFSAETRMESAPPSVPGFAERYAMIMEAKKASLRKFGLFSLQELLTRVVEKVHRLSQSVHLPCSPEQRMDVDSMVTNAGADDALRDLAQSEHTSLSVKTTRSRRRGEAKTKGVRRKTPAAKLLRQKEEAKLPPPPPPPSPVSLQGVDAVPTEMILNSDKELVEWYGFCHEMRQTIITFHESLFLDESAQQTERHNSLGKHVDLPVLHATEIQLANEA